MNIPYGYCHCGGGQKTAIGIRNDKRYGIVKGEPNRFMKHHHKGKMSKSLDLNQERFWSRVDVRDDLSACWNWNRGKSKQGYGRMTMLSKPVYAHRLAYEFTHGSIVSDLDVLHSCDNPSCCNPAHLSLGTHQDNMHDRDLKGRGRKKTIR